jgi:hypothetical protein
MLNLCVDCNENEMIDGFRCFGCGIDFDYAEGLLLTTMEAN